MPFPSLLVPSILWAGGRDRHGQFSPFPSCQPAATVLPCSRSCWPLVLLLSPCCCTCLCVYALAPLLRILLASAAAGAVAAPSAVAAEGGPAASDVAPVRIVDVPSAAAATVDTAPAATSAGDEATCDGVLAAAVPLAAATPVLAVATAAAPAVAVGVFAADYLACEMELV